MNHEIYVFGSATRGEISPSSDLDVLVIRDGPAPGMYPPSWSVYSRATVESYYSAGRLFAWHLHLEATRVYPRSGSGFLSDLGEPAPYGTMADDLADLEHLLAESVHELKDGSPSQVYELGLAYTAIRDIAMSASWALLGKPSFSRYAPYKIPIPCPLPPAIYHTAMSARYASTRGLPLPMDYSAAAEYFKTSSVLEWAELVRRRACQTRS